VQCSAGQRAFGLDRKQSARLQRASSAVTAAVAVAVAVGASAVGVSARTGSVAWKCGSGVGVAHGALQSPFPTAQPVSAAQVTPECGRMAVAAGSVSSAWPVLMHDELSG
jgi:hypothetical protein